MTIAVIDGKINLSIMDKPEKVRAYSIDNGQIVSSDAKISKISHGTLICKIIEQYGQYDELILIEVLKENNRGKIEDLLTALTWCIDKDIDIINLSIGTTDRNDFRVIEMVCMQLIRRGKIIIAANNNKGIFTMPSKMKEVICVKRLKFIKTAFWNLKRNEIYVPGKILVCLKNNVLLKTNNSNSYACAYVTSLLSKAKV